MIHGSQLVLPKNCALLPLLRGCTCAVNDQGRPELRLPESVSFFVIILMSNLNQQRNAAIFQAPALSINVMASINGGGYSMQAKLKSQQKQKEVVEQLEKEKLKEREVLRLQKLEQDRKEQKLAAARLKQIELEQAKAYELRMQQKEANSKMIRQKSNIGKGVRNVSNGLDFLDKMGGPDSKFPIKKMQPKQFTNQMGDEGHSKNLDGLDLSMSMNQKKDYNFVNNVQQPQQRVANNSQQMLESLDLKTGFHSIKNNEDALLTDDVDDEMDAYKKEMGGDWLQASIKASVAQWQQISKHIQVKKKQDFKALQKAEYVPEPRHGSNQRRQAEESKEVEEVFEVVIPKFQPLDPNGYSRLHQQEKRPSQLPPKAPGSIVSGIQSTTTVNTRNNSRGTSKERSKQLLKSDILSKEEEAQIARQKRQKMDELKSKYSKRLKSKGPRDNSPSDITKCTRDEDINIEEFMRDDMREINLQEDKCQRELMQLHQRNLHRHAVAIQKFKIDTGLKCTEDLVRKMILGPTRQPSQERKQLHQLKSAVNKQPHEIRRPEMEVAEDSLNESLDNLDKLLFQIKEGRRETALEQLGKKFGLLGQDQEVYGYSKEEQSTFLTQPVVQQRVPIHNPQKLNPQQIPQKSNQQYIKPEPPQRLIGELKEANLQKLKEKYKQPFSLPQRVDEAEQFSQAPTDKPIRQSSVQPTEKPIRSGSDVQIFQNQQNPQAAKPRPISGVSLNKQTPVQQRMELPKNENLAKQPSLPSLFPPIQNSIFPPIAVPQAQIKGLNMMDDLMNQQRLLQQNIDFMMQMQKNQQEMQRQQQFEDDESFVIEQKPQMPLQKQNLQGKDAVKVNPRFDMKKLLEFE